MTNATIIRKSVLVAKMEKNQKVQLRQENETWWMISPKTGVHYIKSETLNERVMLHWEGFKANQTK